VQKPGGVAGQFTAHQAHLVALRTQQAGAAGGAPERLFSMAGNVITKKRSRLTCDNIKELVYLHEVCPQVQEWEAVKKMRSE